MLEWNRLHQELERAANRHRQLVGKFDQFAKAFAEQAAEPAFHIKGIGVSLNLEQGSFSTSFAGRTLVFIFESAYGENGVLVGKVSCFMKKEFPTPEYISIGNFQFTSSGQSTLMDPRENDPLNIDIDLAALYVVLNYIHESLSQ